LTKTFRLWALLAISLAGFLQITSQNSNEAISHGSAFNYLLPIQGVSDSALTLQHYVNQTTLLFYFNPNCPHCQAAFPSVQSIVITRSSKGLQSLALAVPSASKQSVLDFISTYNASIPFARDTTWNFESSYGSGHVPLFMVIHRDGSYTRYIENSSATLSAIETELDSALAQ